MVRPDDDAIAWLDSPKTIAYLRKRETKSTVTLAVYESGNPEDDALISRAETVAWLRAEADEVAKMARGHDIERHDDRWVYALQWAADALEKAEEGE